MTVALFLLSDDSGIIFGSAFDIDEVFGPLEVSAGLDSHELCVEALVPFVDIETHLVD